MDLTQGEKNPLQIIKTLYYLKLLKVPSMLGFNQVCLSNRKSVLITIEQKRINTLLILMNAIKPTFISYFIVGSRTVTLSI